MRVRVVRWRWPLLLRAEFTGQRVSLREVLTGVVHVEGRPRQILTWWLLYKRLGLVGVFGLVEYVVSLPPGSLPADLTVRSLRTTQPVAGGPYV